LDGTVFNQPGVAGAIEAEFVPVKLNANENSATAQGFGITRVPTDVILTADGQMVGKVISPPTPAGYVAELTQVAREYSARAGQTFANAASAAPHAPQINAAYARLQLAPNTPPAVPQLGSPTDQPFAQTNAAAATPQVSPMLRPIESPRLAAAPALATSQPPKSAAPPPITPVEATPAAPQQFNNPYSDRYGASPPAVSATPAIAASTNPGNASASAAAAFAARTDLSPTQSPVMQASRPAEAQAGAPDPKLLPAGAPPLGFDGYCPVSMRSQWKWVPGDPRWGIVHRGRTYWFASQAEQQMFWTDPDRYSPALSGMDPVMAIDHKQQVPGKREHSIDYDNLFYMFANEATLQQFTANPERYAVGVREAMGIPRGRLVR
jgi:protein disulfide-isomerase